MDTETTPPEEASPGWFDRRENVRKVLIGLFAGCALLVLIDLFFWMTGYDKHPYFRWEKWPGFYAVYGFVACVLLVLVSKHVLRPLVMRGEDYYDKNSDQGGGDA